MEGNLKLKFGRFNVDSVIIENQIPIPVDEALICESSITSVGVSIGATSDITSPQFHQNIVGVEGWLVDFVQGSFTRIDTYEINWLQKHKGYLRMSLDDFLENYKTTRGFIASKRLGL